MLNGFMQCYIKIEEDESNSRYWYSRCSLESYESYLDSTQELKAIKERLK